MKSKALRISVAVIGVALLIWGSIHFATDIREHFHSFGGDTSAFGFSLKIRLHWLLVGIVGALLCVWSLFVKSKRKI